jgi:hypothetical protein
LKKLVDWRKAYRSYWTIAQNFQFIAHGYLKRMSGAFESEYEQRAPKKMQEVA